MDTRTAFLRAFHPAGPWVLTAIIPDRKQIETRTFGLDAEKDASDWITERNGAANLYFNVNLVGRPVTKKVTREEIVSVPWLHIDIDARVGEPLKDELERILRLLTETRPENVPEPTYIIFSGGGYQAFWRLKEPIPINGDLARAEDAARYNQWLEIQLGGDACHNVDRIMRLPGTMNIPDAKKVAKGRVRAQAEVVSHRPENVYDLSQFSQAPKGDTNPQPTANMRRLASIAELDKWKVPDRVKVIIAQGHHPDEPKQGDNSRSAWLYDAVCNLVRVGVPAETILGIILDPSFAISESVRDKSDPESYARRQVVRAKKETEEPVLGELNARFFIVGNYGGKCVVAEEYRQRDDEYCSYGVQRREDFRARFAHRYAGVGTKLFRLGEWWLIHPQARRYDRIVFAPGKRVDEDTYNLWRGFVVPPREGDCSLFMNHVRENIAGEYSEWLLNWMARAVQRPGEQAEVAVVLQGQRGVGKSFFARQFGSLFGPHFLSISNARHLVGNFNAHLEDCVVLLADEAFYAGDKRHGSVLKALITESTLAIERKGFDLRQTGNHLHIIMCSNERWVVPAGLDERRFLVLEVAPTHQQDTVYFRRIADQMNAGGREALLHVLLNRDLDAWDFRRAPDTKSLTDQKLLSLSPAARVIYEMLCTGSHPRSLVKEDRVFVVTEQWAEKVDITDHALSRELRSFTDQHVREIIDGERRRGFWLPPLPEARNRWVTAHKLEWVRWPVDVEQWDAVKESENNDLPF